MKEMKTNPLSMQIDSSKFAKATDVEKEQLVLMRESSTFFKDGVRRLKKNKVAMVSFCVIIVIFIIAFIVPMFWPYSYAEQILTSTDLHPMEYSIEEQAKIANGESVFPHILGTDSLGRDYAIRVMMGTRISLIVGIVAAVLILIIGATYGAVAGFFGGKVDMAMMRVVDVIYSLPDILIIILLSVVLKDPLSKLAGTGALSKLGPGMISIFITFSLLYWVGMARLVRGQILVIKQQDYVMAARALGASNKRIILRHLLPNCISIIIIITTLQIPSAIFTESFLSFLGMGVSAPMPSLGSLTSDAMKGVWSYTYRLIAPSVMICLTILAFNLFGDGLRDAFDPQMRQ